jgi:hypothetical protein
MTKRESGPPTPRRRKRRPDAAHPYHHQSPSKEAPSLPDRFQIRQQRLAAAEQGKRWAEAFVRRAQELGYRDASMVDLSDTYAWSDATRREYKLPDEPRDFPHHDTTLDVLARLTPDNRPFPYPPYVGPHTFPVERRPLPAFLVPDCWWVALPPGVKRRRVYVGYEAATIDVLLHAGRKLLGHRWPKLVAQYHRGRKSPTPPNDVHPLVDLVVRLQWQLTITNLGIGYIDWADVAELRVHVGLLTRYSRSPWASIIGASLEAPAQYRHLLITLLFADMLGSRQGPVALIVSSGSTRVADIAILVHGKPGTIEVKVPRALCRRMMDQPSPPLTHEYALATIEKAYHKAGDRRHGQLTTMHPGTLVLGGFHLYGDDTQVLTYAANDWLIRNGRRRRHVLGIVIVVLNIGRSVTVEGAARAMPGFNTLSNPHARGPSPLNTHSMSKSLRGRVYRPFTPGPGVPVRGLPLNTISGSDVASSPPASTKRRAQPPTPI